MSNLTPIIVFCGITVMGFVRYNFRKEFVGKAVADVKALEKQYPITDKVLFIKAVPVLAGIVLMFFLAPVTNISAAWAAIIGAITLLLLSNPAEIEDVLHKVEWSTLLFFGTLFICMQCISTLGVVNFIAQTTSNFISNLDEGLQLTVALGVIIWVSAFTSAFIDNIPYAATVRSKFLLTEPKQSDSQRQSNNNNNNNNNNNKR